MVLYTEEGFNGGKLILKREDTFEMIYIPKKDAKVSSVYRFFDDYILATHKNHAFRCRNRELYDYWFYAIVPDNIPPAKLVTLPENRRFIVDNIFYGLYRMFSKAKDPQDLLDLAMTLAFTFQDTPLNVFEIYEREGF